MKIKSEILYRLAEPDDRDSILKFMREHYYPDEPLTNASEPKKQDIYDEEFHMSLLTKKENANIVAICDGEMVGVRLAAPKGTNEEQLLLEEASKIPGTKWAKALLLLAQLERASNVFEKYQVDKIMHGQAVAAHRKFRGRGIGLKLYEKTMERAKELGYEVFSNDCTSVHSIRMCERFGMECVNEFAFADFRMPNCESQVFIPPEGHSMLKTYAKRLSKNTKDKI